MEGVVVDVSDMMSRRLPGLVDDRDDRDDRDDGDDGDDGEEESEKLSFLLVTR